MRTAEANCVGCGRTIVYASMPNYYGEAGPVQIPDRARCDVCEQLAAKAMAKACEVARDILREELSGSTTPCTPECGLCHAMATFMTVELSPDEYPKVTGVFCDLHRSDDRLKQIDALFSAWVSGDGRNLPYGQAMQNPNASEVLVRIGNVLRGSQ